VSDSQNSREANVLGALSLAIVDRVRDATEASAGHSAAAPAALVALHQFVRGGSMDDLRKVLGLTPSGAVRLVDRLAADGYVERGPGADGRSLALTLTPSGRRVARRVLSARAEALDAVLAPLTGPERVTLTRISEKLLRGITVDRLAARGRGSIPSGGWLCRLCDHGACGRDRGTCPAASAAGTGPPEP
jgi:MarR family transcriptional repressor of emrRAB